MVCLSFSSQSVDQHIVSPSIESNRNKATETPDFQNFLRCLGKKVVLQGWDKYAGGLDTRDNSTGTHSVFNNFCGFDIMFHVSTMLPFTPDDPQQVERKRHLGNDIVLIIFQDGSGPPYKPTSISSNFIREINTLLSPFLFSFLLFGSTRLDSHLESIRSFQTDVTIVVQVAHRDNTGAALSYRVWTTRKQEVDWFAPTLPDPPIFKTGVSMHNFIMSKGENTLSLFSFAFPSRLSILLSKGSCR